MTTDRQVRALRFWLGVQVTASVIANYLGAEASWQARVVAIPPPLVLFGCIEAMLRIPGAGPMGWARGLVTTIVGAAAGALSFTHIGDLGHAAGLNLAERVALVITLDGGMLVVALTLLMVHNQAHKQARPKRRRRPPAAEPRPTTQAEELPTGQPVPLEVAAGRPQELDVEERRALVEARTKAGDTAQAIAAEVGCHVRTVRRDRDYLRDAGRLEAEQGTAA